MINFSIQHQLTLREYRKISFTLLYSKLWFRIICICAILYVICTCVLYLLDRHDILNNENYSPIGAVLISAALWMPVVTYFMVIWNFKKTYRLNEPMTYDFSENGVVVTGESFTSKYDWAKVYQVQIIKDWLLIYHSHRSMSLIKIVSKDQENIEALKQVLKAANFRAKLKW